MYRSDNIISFFVPEHIKFEYNMIIDSSNMLCNQYEHSSHDVLGFSQRGGVSEAVKAQCVDVFTTFDARQKEMLEIIFELVLPITTARKFVIVATKVV